MVDIDTTPEYNSASTGNREESLERWIKRTQEVLAHRSLQGRTFHRLYSLMRSRRLIEVALNKVLMNDGAKTAGVDGTTRRSLDVENGRGRRELVDELTRELGNKAYRPSPVRRVYIPKPNGDKRPLGIPTIKDRVVQEMLRLILEPIYEAKFYGHSYGFRPFRSTHHAALRVKDLIGKRGFTIAIEGDIRKCFDRVHHKKLLSILRRTIKDERIVKMASAMLKAGVMENGLWHDTDAGTPQGGVISPLLANIYLNELDQFIRQKWDVLTETEKVRNRRLKTGRSCYIVRYADDFIVLTKGTMEEANKLKEEIARFLSDELHLELSAEKTLVTPVTKGMDFLGFHIRKYKRSNQTLITPSKKAQERFREKVKQRAWEGFNNGDAAGIVTINRFIIGWGQYYRRVSSARVFKSLDHYVWYRVWKTTRRLRMPGRRRSRVTHHKNHYIRYRFDLNRKNRWRRGGHYGAWADRARERAYIVTQLSFMPIVYVNLHPQLNPYVPEERIKLEMLRGLQNLFADLAKNDPKANEDYGPEWSEARYAVLTEAGFTCERCGRPITGRAAHVHHKIPLQQSKTRRQANLLENLTALCPGCHKRVERDTQGR